MTFQDPNQNIFWQGWLTHTYVRLIHRKKWNKLCNSVFDLKIKFCKEAWIKLRWHALGPCNFFFFVYFFCGRGGGEGLGCPLLLLALFCIYFFVWGWGGKALFTISLGTKKSGLQNFKSWRPKAQYNLF